MILNLVATFRIIQPIWRGRKLIIYSNDPLLSPRRNTSDAKRARDGDLPKEVNRCLIALLIALSSHTSTDTQPEAL